MKKKNCSKSEISKLELAKKNYKKNKDINGYIRSSAILKYKSGMSTKKICDFMGISHKSLKRWIGRYSKDGVNGLSDSTKSGREKKLTDEQLSKIKETIEEDKERVWVARHILQLIYSLYQITFNIKYLPQLLHSIGLSFHKAVHYLVRRNEEKRKKWLEEILPEIYEKHIKEGYKIWYQDEVGFQTEGTLSYTWGKKGVKIEIKNKGRHGRVNIMGAFEVGTGAFFYKPTKSKVHATKFKRFLISLYNAYPNDRHIIIADNASFHKSKEFTAWWQSKEWLEMKFLPPYSPDFNPIEGLWKWIKKEYTHNKCWETKESLYKYLNQKLDQMALNPIDFFGVIRKESLKLIAGYNYHNISPPANILEMAA